MEKERLSKSKYCSALQCKKMLWLRKYMPEVAEPEDKDAVFANGTRVGELAKNLFGEYEDVEYNKDLDIMVEKTDKLLKGKPNIITEASFKYDNNFCSVDILKNDIDGVEIYEVKSSTSISNIYVDDASYQCFVLTKAGYNVKKVSIVYINGDYIRQEELEIDKLFNIEDITEIAFSKLEEIRETNR